MKFIVDQEILNSSLQLLQAVVPYRSPLPVLQNVRIQADDNGLFCTTTNLEVATRIQIEADIEEPGDVILNCKKLAELVRVLPQNEIKFSLSASDRMTITSKSGRYRLIGMSSEEFPILPKCEGSSFSVEGQNLVQLIESTLFAASTEEVRYALNALYFNFKEDHLEVVATDGKKLSLIIYPEGANAESTNFLLPSSAAHEIKRSFATSEMVTVTVAENQVLLTDGKITLICRLLDAEYPTYTKILEVETTGSVVLNTRGLLESVRRVAMLANNKNYGVEIILPEDEQQARVFATTPEYGEGEEFLEVSDQSGSIHVGVDSRFIIQILSQINEPTVRMSFSSADKPVIFEPAEEKDQTCLLMPMKI